MTDGYRPPCATLWLQIVPPGIGLGLHGVAPAFANVENVAAGRIGRETVQYVGNIFERYIAYRLTLQ